MTHIDDITFLKRQGGGSIGSGLESSYTIKQLVIKVAQLEREVAQLAGTQLDMARVLDQCNSLIFSQVQQKLDEWREQSRFTPPGQKPSHDDSVATPGDRMAAKAVTSARYQGTGTIQDESAAEVISETENEINKQQNSQPSIDRLTVALNSSTLSLLQQEPFLSEKQSAVQK